MVVSRCLLVVLISKVGGKTAEAIAYTLKTVGLADCVMGSSTMDFAAEEGFENDGDAMKLWDAAIEIYNWEVNGVAG